MTPMDRFWRGLRFALWVVFWYALLVSVLYYGIRWVEAHSWYDSECCSSSDCEMMAEKFLPQSAREWILPNGERVPIENTRPSLDGDFHWCRHNGKDGIIRSSGKPVCLYVPPGGV